MFKDAPRIQEVINKYAPIESYWRYSCMEVWGSALGKGVPESRDYDDWVAPFIRRRPIKGEDWAEFWMIDVDPNALLRNRLTSIVEFFQHTETVTSGNAADMLHANHVMDCDLLVTADKAFFRVLKKALEYMSLSCSVRLIDRSKKSALSELQTLLGQT